MKNRYKFITWLLIVALLCGQVSPQVFAQEIANGQDLTENRAAATVSGGNAVGTTIQEGISLEGDNSFGTMMANELSTEILEQKENNGFNVFSIEMQDEVAVVSFESVEDAILVVGIYDETGAELLTSGSQEVFAGEKNAYIEFEAGSIPQYFYIKGYLIEEITYRPLCTVYESPMYTQEMQEFLAKTIEDFDSDRVLNLDENTANNFAVFSEETILLSKDNGNEITTMDESNNVYVIENADSAVTALQPGDVFAYTYQDNEVLIVKVASIALDGTTVTITGADASMEEVFDYIKIDEEMGSGEATVDASSCGDGVTYEGLVNYVGEDTPQSYGFEVEGSLDKALQLKLDHSFGSVDGISVEISGGLDLNLKFSAKIYLNLETQYVELKLDYSAKIAATITGQASAEVPLITVGFMFTGIIVELTPSIVVEAEATISIEGTLSGTVGFRAEVGKGITNLTTYPQFKSTLKVEGSLFVGFSLCPRVKILSEKIASASLTAKVGVEVKASLKDPLEQEENKVHTCEVCVAGEVNGKFNISASLEFLNTIKFTITPVDWSRRIFDFYYSLDKDEFDIGTCPYYLYKGTVIVKDEAWGSRADITVRINNDYLDTNENGEIEFWAPEGTYIVYIAEEGYAKSIRELTLKKGGETLILLLENVKVGDEDSEGNNNQEENIWNEVKQIALGEEYSAAITEAGDLYLWGDNEYGQLGDGTNEASDVPKKIMSGIKSVSAGYGHSAAITEDGDLYLWGYNWYGQLGDGRTGNLANSNVPEEIMSGVKVVSVGGNHSAAITEDGDLYLWGCNDVGQLGDGTYTNSEELKKIMSGVKMVCTGGNHSAAITENGDLYLWGDNEYGQLGDGTNENSNVPKKIMSGIKAVSLGNHCSAAITEDGDLYLWGWNEWGQLGDGTNENINVPQKIMSEVRAISVEVYHNAAITEDGDLYLWGCNWYGQLGDGTSENINVPQKIMSEVKEVSVGYGHSAAITEDGNLYTWGLNVWGQLGNGKTSSSSVPIKIDILPMTEATFYGMRQVTNGVATLSEEQNSWNGTNFTNLTPNETYNYYIMSDKEAEVPFSTNNLLYIGQAIADTNGAMDVAFSTEIASVDGDIFAVPMHRMDLSEAAINVENLTYNGEKQYAEVLVSYQDKLLTEGVDYNVYGDYGATEPGEYTLSIAGIGLYDGTVSATYQMVKEKTGHVLKGEISSFGEETAEATIQVWDESENLVEQCTISGNNAAFVIDDVEEGSYILRFTKENHVTRDYSITVSEADVQLSAELYLAGDVNGDGRINAKDKKIIYNHIAGESLLQEYVFLVGDVNGDGKINAKDKKMIYNHIAGESMIW